MAHKKNTERDLRIYKLILLGVTVKELGAEYGISTERIKQVFRAVNYKMERARLEGGNLKSSKKSGS